MNLCGFENLFCQILVSLVDCLSGDYHNGDFFNPICYYGLVVVVD